MDQSALDEVARTVALGVSAATGEEFFRALVLHLAAALGMEYSLVGELEQRDGTPGSIRPIAVAAEGRIVQMPCYELPGTPCEAVVGGRICSYSRGVSRQFREAFLLRRFGVESYVGAPLVDRSGRRLGLLGVMGRRALRRVDLAEAVLGRFAPRTAAELARLRSGEELTRLKTFYEQLLDHLPIDLAVFDTEGRFEYLNPSAVADPEMRRWLIGRCEEDYGSRRGLDPAIAAVRRDAQRRAVEEGTGQTITETLRGADGEPRHFVRSLVPVRDPAGRIDRVIGYGLDVTERVRAEEELRQSSAAYRAMFENNSAVKLLIDPGSGTIVDANPAAAGFYRRPLSELLQVRIQELHEAEGRDVLADLAAARVGTGSCFIQRHRVGEEDLRYVEVYVGPIEVASRPLLFAIVRDVTERRRAEDALRESEARYRSLFEQSKDVVYMSTPEGSLLDINPAGVELFGYTTKEEMLALDIGRDMYVDPWQRDQLARRLEEHGFVKDIELFLKTRSGRHLTVQGTTSAVRDDSGRVVAYLGILRDVTAQRQLEEQLRQSQKMEAVGRLAGGLAHDFNNLLTAINGYCDLILHQEPGKKDVRPYVEEVYRAGQRAAELTKKMLTLSRRKAAAPQLLDLNAIVKNLESLVCRLIGEDIELVTRLGSDLGQVRADPAQVEQALLNLVVNARDAMPGGGRLVIETRNCDPGSAGEQEPALLGLAAHVCLSVQDSGVGIAAEVQQHIFEPFFTTKEVGERSGLGLSTVYAIVRQSDGRIDVESSPGRGTIFRIYLPRTDAPRPEPAAASPPRHLEGGEQVLLVEDEPTVRRLVRTLLERRGYRVHEAADANRALELVATLTEPVDLLLSDVVMPGMSGPELARRLGARYPELRILFISGYTGSFLAQHGWSESDHVVLHKPFDGEQLARKVREVLEAPRSRPA